MTFHDWEDEIARSGWSFGLNIRKQMLADWRTDRTEWRAELREAEHKIELLEEKLKNIKPDSKS